MDTNVYKMSENIGLLYLPCICPKNTSWFIFDQTEIGGDP